MADIIETFISDHMKVKLAIDRYAANKQCISENDILKEVKVTQSDLAQHVIVFTVDEYWEPAIGKAGVPEVFCSLTALEQLNALLRKGKSI